MLRVVSQFHENERLDSWLKSRRSIVWLTPSRRRRVLVFGAVVGGTVGLYHRHADWRDYALLSTWLAPGLALPLLFGLVYLLYFAAKHFSQLLAVVRRRRRLFSTRCFCPWLRWYG